MKEKNLDAKQKNYFQLTRNIVKINLHQGPLARRMYAGDDGG
jgi:hypothetical protein